MDLQSLCMLGVIALASFALSFYGATIGLILGHLRLPLLMVMSASWALIGYFSESALPGILLLVLAGVLPWIMPLRWAIFWLALDTLALIPVLVSTTDWT